MLLEISGEVTPERMKGWSQSKNSTQLWMGLVIEAKSDAVNDTSILTSSYFISFKIAVNNASFFFKKENSTYAHVIP